MECFGTTDFDNNSRLITLSVIIISGLHCANISEGPAASVFVGSLKIRVAGASKLVMSLPRNKVSHGKYLNTNILLM